MKKIFILMFILISSFGIAQTYTWTNADMDNDFENPNNWNPVPMFGFPSAGETVVFDGTVSNANCNMPNDNTLNLINIYRRFMQCQNSHIMKKQDIFMTILRFFT